MADSERRQASQPVEPTASRPRMPGYGVPDSGGELVSWDRVTERLEQARHYWVATVRPDGRPHVAPIWGVWLDDTFYTEGGGRKVDNLRANPQIAVHLESGEDVAIVEGIATEMSRPERALFERIDAAYAAKYDYKPSDNLAGPEDVPYPDGGLFAVRPRVVFAWSRFPEDATRFLFADNGAITSADVTEAHATGG